MKKLVVALFLLILAQGASPQLLGGVVPVAGTSGGGNSASSDSSDAAPGKSSKDTTDDGVHFVMRNFDHKQQMIVGSVVMFCVALTLVAMNNYNPRR